MMKANVVFAGLIVVCCMAGCAASSTPTYLHGLVREDCEATTRPIGIEEVDGCYALFHHPKADYGPGIDLARQLWTATDGQLIGMVRSYRGRVQREALSELRARAGRQLTAELRRVVLDPTMPYETSIDVLEGFPFRFYGAQPTYLSMLRAATADPRNEVRHRAVLALLWGGHDDVADQALAELETMKPSTQESVAQAIVRDRARLAKVWTMNHKIRGQVEADLRARTGHPYFIEAMKDRYYASGKTDAQALDAVLEGAGLKERDLWVAALDGNEEIVEVACEQIILQRAVELVPELVRRLSVHPVLAEDMRPRAPMFEALRFLNVEVRPSTAIRA